MKDLFDGFLRDLDPNRQPEHPDHDSEDEPPSEGGPGDRSGPRDAGSGPGRPPGRPPRAPRRSRGIGPTAVLIAIVVVVFAILGLAGSGVDLWTDIIWFGSVGYDGVFWTRLGAQAALFVAIAAVVAAVLLINLWLAGRLAPAPGTGGGSSIRELLNRINDASRATRTARTSMFGPRPTIVVSDDDLPELPDLTPVASAVLVVVAILAALATGAAVAGSWETVLLWQHRVPYAPDPGAAAVVDPVFGREIGFFLFELPFWRLVQSIANGVVLAALLLAGARYVVAALRSSISLTRGARLHLGVLAALLLATIAAGYQVDKLELAYSARGVAIGVSYADQAAQFLALDVLTVIAIVVAILVAATTYLRRPIILGVAVGAWLVATVGLLGIYPEFVQRFSVQPNEFALEKPYIQNNISMTRLAFDLNGWEEQSYRGEGALTQAKVDSEQATFGNARLWDYRPLGSTLDQLQTVRQYYDFVDVDTDRYDINGRIRQVMLSARELAPEKNPQAQTWVNQRITYTHGFGLAMVPVNEVTPEGLPQLIVRDMPPVSSAGAPVVKEPRIYFGERPSDYVIVNARQPEFDYPLGGEGTGDQSATTTWSGKAGISLASPVTKLLFSLRFRDLNLLISDQLTDGSRLLLHRSLADRVPRIAPFLRYDKDPYVVITNDGRLVYVWDAYTTSDRFPHAESMDPGQLGGASGLAGAPFNYLRNSVKVVVDAYDGTTTFYAADPRDPILRAYEGVFPGLFHPLDEMPADIRAHLRVPEEQFNIQARMFATYHVQDPQTFYRKDDLWTVPVEPTGGQSLPMEAYYVIMRMPGEAKPEFLLLQPMVPTNRPNMIAWIAARSDAPNYGAVRVYRFPRDTSIYGPNQIEARIDQDPIISAQITLWNQSGSTVVRGNLIVVPIQDTLMYLEPVYLQSTSSQFPEFQKIIVASPTRVEWADTLAQALDKLIASGVAPGGSPGPSASPGASPSPGTSPTPVPTSSTPAGSPPPSDIRALVDYANAHFEAAQQALRAGDFARYGDEMKLVESALQQLSQLAGPTATPAVPSTSPASAAPASTVP
jgi:uncharacterized protein